MNVGNQSIVIGTANISWANGIVELPRYSIIPHLNDDPAIFFSSFIPSKSFSDTLLFDFTSILIKSPLFFSKTKSTSLLVIVWK